MYLIGHFCLPKTEFTSSTNMENAFKSAFFNQLLGNKWATYAFDIYKSWWIILVSVVVAWIFATVFLYAIKKFGGIMLWVSFLCTGIIFFVLGFYAFFFASNSFDEENPARNYCKIVGVICWLFIPFLCVSMCCSLNSLLLGIAVFKTTCDYVSKNSYVMLLPTVSCMFTMVWFFIWILSAVFIFSIGEPKPREDFPMITEVEWTESSRWMVAFHFFALLWINEFIYSSVQFIIGASTCIWYFDSSSDNKGDVKQSVKTAASWLFKYHWSSIALGSMIIALCETIRYIFEYYRKKMGAIDKAMPCIKILFCLTGYCLFILEECIKYISKNAYI